MSLNEKNIDDILREFSIIKEDLGRIWKYLDKIKNYIKFQDSIGIVSDDVGNLVGMARHVDAPKDGDEFKSILENIDVAQQGIECVEKEIDNLEDLFIAQQKSREE